MTVPPFRAFYVWGGGEESPDSIGQGVLV